jgi:hypothetical protein
MTSQESPVTFALHAPAVLTRLVRDGSQATMNDPSRFLSSPRWTPYREALTKLSVRTGASVPSLVASFLVLHEVTAIVPFVGVFFASRAFGVGETVVQAATENQGVDSETGWVQDKTRQWVDEGGQMAERLGRRYGLFGFEKRGSSSVDEANDPTSPRELGDKIAGDVANIVVAYGVTKVYNTLYSRLPVC